MTTRPLWTCLVLALAFAAGGVACRRSGQGDNPGGGTSGKPDPRNANNGSTKREYAVPVGVIKLDRRSMSEYVSTVGTVAPGRSLSVKAEESGRILFVKPWREGDFVKKGELLARLDEEETNREIEISRADLESARSRLELALARLEQARTDFDRAQRMLALGQISQKAYEEREYNAQSAKINYDESVIGVRKAEKSLDRLLIQRDRKNVRAPMSGYLVTRDAVESPTNPSAADSAETITDLEGRLVGTGNTICGVVDTSNILIRCDVTSKDIAKIRKDQRAEAHVYSDQEIAVAGDVTDISPIMDMQTRAFKVDVAVPNKEGRLRPGMFSRVNVIIKTHRDALVVDRKILQRRNNQDVVFVVNDEDRAERRVVKLGLENPDEVEIIDGLRAGERLVTLGYETLQDKVKIKIVETDVAVAKEDTATSVAAEDATTSSTREDAAATSPTASTRPPAGGRT